jgi:hypothetical protein
MKTYLITPAQRGLISVLIVNYENRNTLTEMDKVLLTQLKITLELA